MTTENIGAFIFTFVIIYFLFVIGKKLAYQEYRKTFLPWSFTIFFFIFGIATHDIIGLIFCIPIITYVFMKIFEDSEKNIKRIFLGAMGSVMMEIVASGLLGVSGIESLIASAISFVLYSVSITA